MGRHEAFKVKARAKLHALKMRTTVRPMSRSRLDEPCLESRGSDADHRLTAADVDRRERIDEVHWLWLGRGRLWQTDSQFCAK